MHTTQKPKDTKRPVANPSTPKGEDKKMEDKKMNQCQAIKIQKQVF